jgi:hypothetical protein
MSVLTGLAIGFVVGFLSLAVGNRVKRLGCNTHGASIPVPEPRRPSLLIVGAITLVIVLGYFAPSKVLEMQVRRQANQERAMKSSRFGRDLDNEVDIYGENYEKDFPQGR